MTANALSDAFNQLIGSFVFLKLLMCLKEIFQVLLQSITLNNSIPLNFIFEFNQYLFKEAVIVILLCCFIKQACSLKNYFLLVFLCIINLSVALEQGKLIREILKLLLRLFFGEVQSHGNLKILHKFGFKARLLFIDITSEQAQATIIIIGDNTLYNISFLLHDALKTHLQIYRRITALKGMLCNTLQGTHCRQLFDITIFRLIVFIKQDARIA